MRSLKSKRDYICVPANLPGYCFGFLVLLVFAASAHAQTHWLKHAQNPAISMSPGIFDRDQVYTGPVIFDGGVYKMWYGSSAIFGFWNSGYATSTNGIDWSKQSDVPVLDLGSTNSWDDQWAFASSVLHDGNSYQMWYSGLSTNDNKRRIGFATSFDGIVWQKYDDPNTTSSLFAHSDPVVDVGVIGSWNSRGVWYPSVYFDGSMYHMWYTGQNDQGYSSLRVGYASSPDGVHWTQHPDNPVLNPGPAESWDADAVGTCTVVYYDKKYHMWYGGMENAAIFNALIGYAVSEDGIQWTKHESNPILSPGSPGSWDALRIDSPFVLYDETNLHMWYAGKDAANKGRIGYAADFTNIAHANNLTLSHTYAVPGVDTLLCTTKVINKKDHSIDVAAIIENMETSLSDSVLLHNDGMGSWTGLWPLPTGEHTYLVSIKIVGFDSDAIFHSSTWGLEKRVTTLGPVVFSGFQFTSPDTIPNPGDNLRFNLSLRNTGTQSEGRNISAQVFSNDVCVITNPQIKTFGEIPPGETVTAGTYSLRTAPECANTELLFHILIASDGYTFWSDSFKVAIAATGISLKNQNAAKIFKLHQNYPNPFNPTTTIEYTLLKAEHVRITIYDMLSRHIKTLVDADQPVGCFQTTWNGTDENNIPVATGVYSYKIRAGDFVQVNKLVLVR